jgi:hypothetical protein
MIKHINDPDSNRWQVIDLDTGKQIRRCQWADDEKGEYEVHILDKNDLWISKIKKGNIKLVKRRIGEIYCYTYMRGHEIECKNSKWYYCDNGELADHDRPCKRCGRMPTKEGYDACIGYVEGAIASCCGHGVKKPYIKF